MKTYSCRRCGMAFRYSHPRQFCDECLPLWRQENAVRRDGGAVSWDNVLHHVELRLAAEMAVALLKLGRPRDALAALEAVPARARVLDAPPIPEQREASP
ncbi:hypothetical protein [Nocardioides sp.]|uniref:hypothetical protein n=1 Tax=Nocardioides sp. TaxID=35761 RepID=UPI002C940720|nr:hypothetical protein [Nocardioides sp.]HXH79942.1 hypothetical protein [Nocardioides sp.]